MDFIKRIGTQRHKFKVQFFLTSLTCDCNTKKLRGDVYIQIKRSQHKAKSHQHQIIFDDNGTYDLKKQILAFPSLTLFYDSNLKTYQQKTVQVKVIIIADKQKKLLGKFDIDIAQCANSHKQSIQFDKHFGNAIKSILKFDIFIKFLGQSNSTSQSLSKHPSVQTLSPKHTDLLKPKKISIQTTSQQNISGDQNSHKQTAKSANIKKQSDKIFLTQSREDKNNIRKQQKSSKNNDQLKKKDSGSHKQLTNKRKTFTNSLQGSNEMTPKKQVTSKKKSPQPSSQQDEQIPPTSTERPHIFFDQFSSQNSSTQPYDKIKQPFDSKPNKQKRTQYAGIPKQQQKSNTKKPDNSDIIPSTIQNYQKLINQYKQQIQSLQQQKNNLQQTNSQLTTQTISLKQTIKNLSTNKNTRTSNSKSIKQQNDDQKYKKYQKQKIQLLLKIQTLQQKYKKDFNKYQQTIQQYQQQKKQHQDQSKAEIKRLKQQFIDIKSQLDKKTKLLQQKIIEIQQSKKNQNNLKQQIVIAQNNLSSLKLKIGQKLNDANQFGNKSVIDILTQLSY